MTWPDCRNRADHSLWREQGKLLCRDRRINVTPAQCKRCVQREPACKWRPCAHLRPALPSSEKRHCDAQDRAVSADECGKCGRFRERGTMTVRGMGHKQITDSGR